MPAALIDDAVSYLRQNGMPITTETLGQAQNALSANPAMRPSYVQESGNTQASMMANMGAPSSSLPSLPFVPGTALTGTQPLPEADAYFNKPAGRFEYDIANKPYEGVPASPTPEALAPTGAGIAPGTPLPGLMQPVPKPVAPRAPAPVQSLPGIAPSGSAVGTNAPVPVPRPVAPVAERIEPAVGGVQPTAAPVAAAAAPAGEDNSYLLKILAGLSGAGALALGLRGGAATSGARPRGAPGLGIGQGGPVQTGTDVELAGLMGDIIPPNQKQISGPPQPMQNGGGPGANAKVIGSNIPQPPQSSRIGQQTVQGGSTLGVPVGKPKSAASSTINVSPDKRAMLENMTGKDKPKAPTGVKLSARERANREDVAKSDRASEAKATARKKARAEAQRKRRAAR